MGFSFTLVRFESTTGHAVVIDPLVSLALSMGAGGAAGDCSESSAPFCPFSTLVADDGSKQCTTRTARHGAAEGAGGIPSFPVRPRGAIGLRLGMGRTCHDNSHRYYDDGSWFST
jgi:hypothetical protein